MNVQADHNQFQEAAAAKPRRSRFTLPPKGSRARRHTRYAVIFAAAVAITAFVYPWIAARWTHVALDDARIAGNMITVSSEVSGRITSLKVIAGDRVTRGDVVATIDNATAAQELKGLEAQVAGVKSQQNQLRAQQDFIRGQVKNKLEGARTQIIAAEAAHTSAEAALENAKALFERATTLSSRGVTSVQQLDDAKAKYSAATQQERITAAGISTANANVDIIRSDENQIGVIEQQIATLDAQAQSLEAQIAQKRIDLARREIKADFDGVIDSTFVDPGEYVSAGTRMLIYHDPNTVWVDANIKETDFRRVELGRSAHITVDAYPSEDFTGKVTRIGEAATSQFALLPSPNPSGNFTKVTQRLPIRLSINQHDELLRPGMMVEVSIDVR